MDEENKEQETTAPAESAGEPAGPKKEKKKKDFLTRLKEKRQKKADARNSMILDIVVLIVVFVFASWFSPKKYSDQATPLLYYYEDASVLSCEEVVHADTGEHRWKVNIQYDIGNDSTTKSLYYKKNPKLKEGDIIHLKIQTVNPDNVVIEGVDRK